MDIQKLKTYWLEESDEAMQVAWHLYEKQDYSYALFFAHLAVEKAVKSIYVQRKKEHAPYLHNLLRLAELSGIAASDAQRSALLKITSFHLEARYPDEKRTFRKICTQGFVMTELRNAEDVLKWLKSMMK